MAWKDVTDYFEGIMSAEGFSRHDEAFAFDNIANSRLEKAYQLAIGSITGDGQNQSMIESTMPVTLRFFKKGYRDPFEARNQALKTGQTIVQKALKSEDRVSSGDFQNVEFDSLTPEPLALDNNHIILVTIEFTVTVFLDDLN